MHWQQLCRRLCLGCFQMTAPAPIVRVLDVERLVFEVAIQPAQSSQFPSPCSKRSIQEHQKLVAELQIPKTQCHLLRRQHQRRFLPFGTHADAHARTSLAAGPNGYSGGDWVLAAELPVNGVGKHSRHYTFDLGLGPIRHCCCPQPAFHFDCLHFLQQEVAPPGKYPNSLNTEDMRPEWMVP